MIILQLIVSVNQMDRLLTETWLRRCFPKDFDANRSRFSGSRRRSLPSPKQTLAPLSGSFHAGFSRRSSSLQLPPAPSSSELLCCRCFVFLNHLNNFSIQKSESVLYYTRSFFIISSRFLNSSLHFI